MPGKGEISRRGPAMPPSSSRVSQEWLHDASVAAVERYSVNAPAATSSSGLRPPRPDDIMERLAYLDSDEEGERCENADDCVDEITKDTKQSSESEGLADNRRRLISLTKPDIAVLRARNANVLEITTGSLFMDEDVDVGSEDMRSRCAHDPAPKPALPEGYAVASALDPRNAVAGRPETWTLRDVVAPPPPPPPLPASTATSVREPMLSGKRLPSLPNDAKELSSTSMKMISFPQMEDVQYDDIHGSENDDNDDTAATTGQTGFHDNKGGSRCDKHKEEHPEADYETAENSSTAVHRPAPPIGAIAGLPATWTRAAQDKAPLPTDTNRSDGELTQPDSSRTEGRIHEHNDGAIFLSSNTVHGSGETEPNEHHVYHVPLELDDILASSLAGSDDEMSHDGDAAAKEAETGEVAAALALEIAAARRSSRVEWQDTVAHHERLAKVAETRAERAEAMTKRLTSRAILAREECEAQAMRVEEEMTLRERAEQDVIRAREHVSEVERVAIERVTDIALAERRAIEAFEDADERYRIAVEEVARLQAEVAAHESKRECESREAKFVAEYIAELRRRLRSIEEEAAAQRGMRAAAESTVAWWEATAKDGAAAAKLEAKLTREKEEFLRLASKRKDDLAKIQAERVAVEETADDAGTVAAAAVRDQFDAAAKAAEERRAAARAATQVQRVVEEALLDTSHCPPHLLRLGLLYRAVLCSSPAHESVGTSSNENELCTAALASAVKSREYRILRGHAGFATPTSVIRQSAAYVLVSPVASLCYPSCVAELIAAYECRSRTRLVVAGIAGSPETRPDEGSVSALLKDSGPDAVRWFMDAWDAMLQLDPCDAEVGAAKLADVLGMSDACLSVLPPTTLDSLKRDGRLVSLSARGLTSVVISRDVRHQPAVEKVVVLACKSSTLKTLSVDCEGDIHLSRRVACLACEAWNNSNLERLRITNGDRWLELPSLLQARKYAVEDVVWKRALVEDIVALACSIDCGTRKRTDAGLVRDAHLLAVDITSALDDGIDGSSTAVLTKQSTAQLIDACMCLARSALGASAWISTICGVHLRGAPLVADGAGVGGRCIGVATLSLRMRDEGLTALLHRIPVAAENDAEDATNSDALLTLSMRDWGLGVHGATLIAAAMRKSSAGIEDLTAIDLRGNKVGPRAGSSILAAVAAGARSLVEINIDGCEVSDAAGISLASSLWPRHAEITRLNLSGNKLGCKTVVALASARLGKGNRTAPGVEELFLARNSIAASGVAALSRALCATSTSDFASWSPLSRVVNLNLAHNVGVPETAIRTLANALRNGAPALRQLDISRCSVGTGGASAIADALIARGEDHRLDVLRMNGCKLHVTGVVKLCGALALVGDLGLARNGMGDQGAASIACALQQESVTSSGNGPRLRRLDLRDNVIGKEGGRRLVESLQRASLRRGVAAIGKTLEALEVENNRLDRNHEVALRDLDALRGLASIARRNAASSSIRKHVKR